MILVEDTCTPSPQSCESGFHTDSKGDCVSDVSVQQLSNH